MLRPGNDEAPRTRRVPERREVFSEDQRSLLPATAQHGLAGERRKTDGRLARRQGIGDHAGGGGHPISQARGPEDRIAAFASLSGGFEDQGSQKIGQDPDPRSWRKSEKRYWCAIRSGAPSGEERRICFWCSSS